MAKWAISGLRKCSFPEGKCLQLGDIPFSLGSPLCNSACQFFQFDFFAHISPIKIQKEIYILLRASLQCVLICPVQSCSLGQYLYLKLEKMEV